MPITKERPLARMSLDASGKLHPSDVEACFAWAWAQYPDPPKGGRKELLQAVISGYLTGSVLRDRKNVHAVAVYNLAILAAFAEERDIRGLRTNHSFPHAVLRSMEGRRCAIAADLDGKVYPSSDRPRLPFVGCDRFDCGCSLRLLTRQQFRREHGPEADTT